MAINIRFKGIIGTLAQIAADKFAGRVAWATDIARMIWYYDATNYGIMARRDVLESFEAGIQDATVTAGQPMVAGASGRYQTQDAAAFLSTIGAVNRAGDIVPGSFEVGPYILSGRALTYGISGEVGFLGVRNASGVFAVDVGQPYGSEVYQQKFSGTGAFHGLRQLIRADSGGSTTVADVMTWNPSGIYFALSLHDALGTQRLSATGAATMASLQASNLSGPGTRPLVADASGNVDDQDAATFRATIGIQSVGRRLWAEKDKAQTYANNERSILGATSVQRMLAANTIADGTVVRLVSVGQFSASSSGSSLVVKLTCGPDGNYLSPYYLASHGIPCAALASDVGYKVEALLYFVGSGASAGAYVELTIQFFGSDGVVSTYRNASVPGSPLDVDGSIDRYLDIFFQVSGGTSSYSTITPTHSFAEIITP